MIHYDVLFKVLMVAEKINKKQLSSCQSNIEGLKNNIYIHVTF